MLFTGEQRDADSGLCYLRARYYDPSIGRFLSQDPLPGGNLYAYVGNSPVNFTDPSGLCVPAAGAGAAAAGAAATAGPSAPPGLSPAAVYALGPVSR